MITVVAVGDFAPLKNLTDCKAKVNNIWQRFKSADMSLANLEIAFTNSSMRADKAITLKADPNIASSLAEAGIDVVSIANNHAMDFGPEGLYDTMEALQKANVFPVGGGEDLDAAFEPIILEKKGIKIAHFGLCSTLPPGFRATEKRPGVAPIRARSRFYIDSVTLDEQPGISPWVETSLVEEDLDYACQKISSIKGKVDFVIVNIHWGIPNGWCASFQGPLADYQQPLAYGLIDAGADLIIGHHPHVVHGIEQYKGGIIAYSLGNFLFHSMGDKHETKLTNKYPPYKVDSLEQGEAREALIMEIDIERHQVEEVRFYPTVLNEDGDPEYLPAQAAADLLNRLKGHSGSLGSEILVKGSIGLLKICRDS